VIVYSKGGTIDCFGDFLIIAPQFEMGEADIKYGLSVLRRSIEDVHNKYIKSR